MDEFEQKSDATDQPTEGNENYVAIKVEQFESYQNSAASLPKIKRSYSFRPKSYINKCKDTEAATDIKVPQNLPAETQPVIEIKIEPSDDPTTQNSVAHIELRKDIKKENKKSQFKAATLGRSFAKNAIDFIRLVSMRTSKTIHKVLFEC